MRMVCMLVLSVAFAMSLTLSWATLGLGLKELWALELGFSKMSRSSTSQGGVGVLEEEARWFLCLLGKTVGAWR